MFESIHKTNNHSSVPTEIEQNKKTKPIQAMKSRTNLPQSQELFCLPSSLCRIQKR